MRLNDVELTILVRDRPITEYLHEAQTFVEGRAGSEYQIEVRNHTWQRLEAVLSVDGLSVIDGKPAGAQSQGYLINAHGVIRIPGWMLNAQLAAKFAFSGMKQSYAAQAGGDRNNGVIGVMAFRERVKPISYPLIYTAMPAIGGVSSPTIGAPWNCVTTSAGSYNTLDSMACSNAVGSPLSSRTLSAEPAEQSLGTAFGQATGFATSTVSFERGDLLATLLCYYDEKRGLAQRGIKIERPVKRKPVQPQAFPAMGCQPPAGWTG